MPPQLPPPVNTAATAGATSPAGTATATAEPSMPAGPSGLSVPSAPALPRASGGHAAAQQLPPRSRGDLERGDLLVPLPGRPIVADICVSHPLAASAVKAAARGTGATAEGNSSLNGTSTAEPARVHAAEPRNVWSRRACGFCSSQ